MLNGAHLRIDMVLTDEHILRTIKALQISGERRISQRRIAEVSGCHENTVRISTRRLKNANRLSISGTQGRRALTYEVIENA